MVMLLETTLQTDLQKTFILNCLKRWKEETVVCGPGCKFASYNSEDYPGQLGAG